MQVKSDVLGYCNLDTELGCFQLPQPDVLAGYRVIISTCAAAGEACAPPRHWPIPAVFSKSAACDSSCTIDNIGLI